MKTKAKNPGYGIEAPVKEWDGTDKKCPFFGESKLRGRSFTGTIVSKDTHRSATVSWVRRIFNKKFERYELRKSKIRSHIPGCIDAKVGDRVLVHECRPLSKTKNTIIVKIYGEDIRYKQKQESIEDDKKNAKPKHSSEDKKPAKQNTEE